MSAHAHTRYLIALAAVVLAAACNPDSTPTAPRTFTITRDSTARDTSNTAGGVRHHMEQPQDRSPGRVEAPR